MSVHGRLADREVHQPTPFPGGVLFMERQIFVSEQNLSNQVSNNRISSGPALTLSSPPPELTFDPINAISHASSQQQNDERDFGQTQKIDEICDNRDFLDDIDHHLHYQLDVEIEQFRSNIHTILSQRTEGSRQMSPLQTVPQFFGSQENNSSDYVQSTSSLTDLMKMEESMTSASSVHEFEEDAANVVVNCEESELLVDRKLNQLLIQLQTSLSVLSNNLCREEYVT